jgi:hypothetical protein
MPDINNLREWMEAYKTANKKTRASMRLKLEEHIEKMDAKRKAKIDLAIERLRSPDLEDRLNQGDAAEVARDILTVIRAIEEYRKENQALGWQNQLGQAQTKLLGALVTEELDRIIKRQDSVPATSLFTGTTTALIDLLYCVTTLDSDSFTSEREWLELLSMGYIRGDERQQVRDKLAETHIHIKESGEMVIDQRSRLRSLPEITFPEGLKKEE